MPATTTAALASTCRRYLDAYGAYVHGFKPEWHHKVWCDKIQAVVDGKTEKKKLLILAHPGTGKSVWISTILPSWYLGNHPDHLLMHFTSSDDNAYKQTNTIKMCLDDNDKHQLVFPDDKARPNKDRGWSQTGLYLKGTPQSERHAAYWGLGMTTHFTGARAHGIIIDDPMSQEGARSENEQTKAKTAYAEDIVPRLTRDPSGWIIAIATRWHELDLPGFWIRNSEEGIEDWDILDLPAIADENKIYPGCTIPGVYPHGEVSLWPKRFPVEWLLKEQKRLGAAAFQCVYQNDPTSLGGTVFRNSNWFKDYPSDFNVSGTDGRSLRERLTVVQFWDLAFSSKTSADWTVAVTVGTDGEGRVYILNVWRAKISELVDPVKDSEQGLAAHVAEHISSTYPAAVGVENNAYQNATTRSLISRVSSLLIKHGIATTIKPIKVVKDKEFRAQLPALVAERGDMFVDKRAHWYPVFLKEIMGFPNAANDDIVDALSGATQLAIEGIKVGPMAKHGYRMQAPQETISSGFNPFGLLEVQYEKQEKDRIQKIMERHRSRRYVGQDDIPIPA